MSSPALPAGTRLGRYEIIQALGSGAMGQVYLARDVSLNRRVAIKVLVDVHLNRSDLRARFAREARAVAAVSHPNVVQIFDISEDEGRPYFVMEYLKGTDCDALLRKRGQLTNSEAVAIGLSSALGLSEAAATGVVHRDVKPANLFLTDRGVVKVTDFGLAKGFELGANLTGDGITLGTPDYMPPEQGQGLPVDTRADIYALGATLFHLLAGRPPFRGADENVGYAEVVVRHIKQPTPRLEEEVSGIDAALAELVYRMLAKNPAERPSYEEVIQSLRDVALRINAAVPVVGSSGSITGSSPVLDEARPRSTPVEGSAVSQVRPPRLPHWAVGMSVASLVIFLGALALYVYVYRLPPLPPPTQEPAPVGGSGSARGPWWRTITPPEGFVLVRVGDSQSFIFVSEKPVTLEEARAHSSPPLKKFYQTTVDGITVAGITLQQARAVTKKLGGRLPTDLEWRSIWALEKKFKIWPNLCEWVEVGAKRQAVCYKGGRDVIRNINLPYRNGLFRVVKDVPRPPAAGEGAGSGTGGSRP